MAHSLYQKQLTAVRHFLAVVKCGCGIENVEMHILTVLPSAKYSILSFLNMSLSSTLISSKAEPPLQNWKLYQ
ncbi:hypothetical protein MTR_2g089825 [Medicago truncatula]|uniref:Uncharacterized protein n=1 Tax=Medicago truncatula TaxID=3880 RepID=A0A072VBQ3_MEDTR|nr:hypothetical protein MTR_2g089825 [Medicago truncatula]